MILQREAFVYLGVDVFGERTLADARERSRAVNPAPLSICLFAFGG
jgi:hypothetical protein